MIQYHTRQFPYHDLLIFLVLFTIGCFTNSKRLLCFLIHCNIHKELFLSILLTNLKFSRSSKDLFSGLYSPKYRARQFVIIYKTMPDKISNDNEPLTASKLQLSGANISSPGKIRYTTPESINRTGK